MMINYAAAVGERRGDCDGFHFFLPQNWGIFLRKYVIFSEFWPFLRCGAVVRRTTGTTLAI
jgi:hypothetical protein